MVRLTQKLLIEQIKELKEIKPRKEWVALTKSQIFYENSTERRVINNNSAKANFLDVIRVLSPHLNLQKRLAYSAALLVFVIVGLIGFAQNTMPGDLLFPLRKITEQSQASLSGQIGAKQNIVILNNRINDLAQAAKKGKKNNIPSVISEINAQASELTKDFKNNLIKDSEAVKELAVSLQTLAYVPGTDLSESSDTKDLYRAVVEYQILDWEKSTLTEEQERVLLKVKELYEAEEHIEALKILSESGASKINY